MPACPSDTSLVSSLKPSRHPALFPESPRSASITRTRSGPHPSATAFSASALWFSLPSGFLCTCCGVDWRT